MIGEPDGIGATAIGSERVVDDRLESQGSFTRDRVVVLRERHSDTHAERH